MTQTAPEIYEPGLSRVDHYRSATMTDRSYSKYCRLLGFDIGMLSSETVLDIGSGEQAIFANEAHTNSVKVVSTNPNWKNTALGTAVKLPRKYSSPRSKLAVAAIAQQLPFQSESFGAVLSVWGVPAYLPESYEEFAVTFREIGRVLTSNGVAVLYPVFNRYARHSDFKTVLDDCFDSWELIDRQPGYSLVTTKPASSDTLLFDRVVSQVARVAARPDLAKG